MNFVENAAKDVGVNVLLDVCELFVGGGDRTWCGRLL